MSALSTSVCSPVSTPTSTPTSNPTAAPSRSSSAARTDAVVAAPAGRSGALAAFRAELPAMVVTAAVAGAAAVGVATWMVQAIHVL